jgi:hypothetical protein
MRHKEILHRQRLREDDLIPVISYRIVMDATTRTSLPLFALPVSGTKGQRAFRRFLFLYIERECNPGDLLMEVSVQARGA